MKLGRRDWEFRHGTMRKWGQGPDWDLTDKHSDTWRNIGWVWTPALCECPTPCILRIDSATKRGRS